MAKNWALVIGINQYDFLQPLNYAKRDAQLMQEFFCNEAGFERVYFFSDDSPDVDGKPTRPYRTNLRRVLRGLFEIPFMEAGDNFWFFFSGHGIRHNNHDYLMPSDGDPGDIENTAIPINFVTERLRRCGADNVVLILDACRSQGTRAGEGIGRQTEEMARTTGVISIFSCSPNEYSYEIDALQQGAFTHVLLEGLGIQGHRATVEQLNQYLIFRVPELVRQHKNARQTPYIIAEPINKSHLILVPKHATLEDITTLKLDALNAECDECFELARQLWIQVLAVSGTDMNALKAIERIARLRKQQDALPQPNPATQNINSPSTTTNSSSTVETVGKSKSITPSITNQPASNDQIVKPPQTDDLSSDRGVNYTRLRDLLADGNWFEADYETYLVMLSVVGREKGDYIIIEEVLNFPCTDLRTIDNLWVKYSSGRFGFSVQKKIYLDVGGLPDGKYYGEAWEKFGDCVRWRVSGTWLRYREVIFDTTAPYGHLPSQFWNCRPNERVSYREYFSVSRISVCVLFSRIESFKVESRGQSKLSTPASTSQPDSNEDIVTEEKPSRQHDLISFETGVDYTRLRDLLKEGKWKEADYETLAVMLKASDRESEGWFSLESLKNFPCSDLRTLDLLWVKYSNGRFGFSAQKLIWESVGEDINKFGSSVGWQKKMVFERIQRDWLYYKNLNFNTNAPSGHLPTFVFPFLRDVRIMRWLPLHNEPSVFLSITLSPLMHRLAYCWDFNDILSIVSPQEKDLIDKLIFLIKDMRQSINTYILARREADRLGLKEGNRLGLTIDQSHEMIRLGLRMDEYHEMMGENLLDQLSLVEKAKKNFLLSCTDLPTVTYKRMSEKF